MLNKYGIKGTFHLNSVNLKKQNPNFFNRISEIYAGHEVACHGATHPTFDNLPPEALYNEVYEDRRLLEEKTGYPVVGMSYPYGRYNEDVINQIKNMGIVYSRTCENVTDFSMPNDFMCWKSTCHYKEALQYGERFMNSREGYFGFPKLLYVWGHASELENNNHWDMFEKFCSLVSGCEDIWYATNIEIYRYLTAQRGLVISVDQKTVYNPSGIDVWFSSDGKAYCVHPDEVLKI